MVSILVNLDSQDGHQSFKVDLLITFHIEELLQESKDSFTVLKLELLQSVLDILKQALTKLKTHNLELLQIMNGTMKQRSNSQSKDQDVERIDILVWITS